MHILNVKLNGYQFEHKIKILNIHKQANNKCQ